MLRRATIDADRPINSSVVVDDDDDQITDHCANAFARGQQISEEFALRWGGEARSRMKTVRPVN